MNQPAASQNAGTIPVEALKRLLPEALGPWRRTGVDVGLSPSPLFDTAVVKAVYAEGGTAVTLTVSDWSALGAVAWPRATSERAVDGGVERSYPSQGRLVRELARPGGPSEMTLTLANGLVLRLEGARSDVTVLRALAERLDLAAFEALQRGGR